MSDHLQQLTRAILSLPKATATSMLNVDLATNAAKTLPITFPSNDENVPNIILFKCLDPVLVCFALKHWLYQSVANCLSECPEILRIDPQELHKLDSHSDAQLLYIPEGAEVFTSGDELKTSLAIIAIFACHDPRIRWFYTPFSVASCLLQLEELQMIKLCKSLTPGTRHHHRILTFTKLQFEKDLPVPHHQDFLKAESITDFAPSITLTAADAMKKLESSEFLHFHPADQGGKDLSEDRYIFELHEAERWLASEVSLNCAEYLLIKRIFFKDFGTDCIRHKEKLDPSASYSSAPADSIGEKLDPKERKRARVRGRGGRREKVRTEAAHVRWLEHTMNWRNTRAKKLVVGWKLLGLLDEGKFLPWAKAGGMLEAVSEEVEDVEESTQTSGGKDLGVLDSVICEEDAVNVQSTPAASTKGVSTRSRTTRRNQSQSYAQTLDE